MKGTPVTYLGGTTESDTLAIYDGDEVIIESQVEAIVSAWKGKLDMTGGLQ